MSGVVDDAFGVLKLVERQFPQRSGEELVVLLAAALGMAIGGATWPREPLPMIVAGGTLIGAAAALQQQRLTQAAMAGCEGSA